MTPTRAPHAGCSTSSRAAILATGSATAARACTRSPPGMASCRAPWGWSPAPEKPRAASSLMRRGTCPLEYYGSLLVTSWGDHRIERYDPRPRGASFHAAMKPVVVGGDDFRPVGIATAPDGSLYMSDWVSKDYTLHGKGRIWRLRNAHPIRQTPLNDPWMEAIALKSAAVDGHLNDEIQSPLPSWQVRRPGASRNAVRALHPRCRRADRAGGPARPEGDRRVRRLAPGPSRGHAPTDRPGRQ